MAEINYVNENKITEISDNKNIIINIGKNIDKEIGDLIQEPKEENLYYFFFKRDIYNENGTRIKEKEKYISLINIFNEYQKEGNDFIFLYFKNIDIDFIKIIFNGFISFDIEDINEKKFILETIKKIIPLFFSKKIFYIIYNQLSKIYRRFNLTENKEILLNKFCKIFELWKIIYDVNDRAKVNSSYITFLGRKDLTLINNNNYNGYQFKEVNVYIEFEDGFCNINDIECELIKVMYYSHGNKNVYYKEIITKENEKINNILFKVNEESINYVLNINDDFDINNSENFVRAVELQSKSNFGQVETLRNYIGKIKKVNLSIEFKDENIQKLYYAIIPKENKDNYEIKPFIEKDGNIGLCIELEDQLNLISGKIYHDILYEDIRYYGGLESFLPMIKIIKYFISHFKDKEDIIKKLNEILIEIMKSIFKFICYSKTNFENFKNILVPLLGALAEINHVYPQEKIKYLYSNNIFSLFYIIIISSSFPFALKKSYMKITGLYNIDQLNLNFDDLLIDKDKLNISSYKWYSTLLMIIIEFILLKFNDINKIPKAIIHQILLLQTNIEKETNKDLTQFKNDIISYIKCGLNFLNYIIKSENKDNNLFLINNNIAKISDYFATNVLNNEFNLSLILLMLKVYLNLLNIDSFWIKLDEEKKEEEKKEEEKKERNTYKNIFENFFNAFEKIINEAKDEIKNKIITSFEDYIINKDYLIKIFPFLSSKNFKLETENILSELTDFHRNYHNIMKRLFIFNKLWSDKKLFFDAKKREKFLKYKSINYYTKNYQKPFIFPDLDYKSTYPAFSCFEIKKEFYIEEENKDVYNFDLDCPEFDEFNIKYEEEIIENIKKKGKINYYGVCLVKRTHHIKGIMFVCNDGYSLIKKIIFYSYPKTISDSIMCCNTYKNLQNVNKKNKKLCFGAVFVCPEKYMNIKIIIPVKDIRMILKKIYFYSKSAIEIFTKNKSYYFNFTDKNAKYSEKNCSDFTNTFAFFISEFSPIAIREEIIGHSRKVEDLLKSYKSKEKKYDISKVANKYVSSLFEHWTSNTNDVEFSTLDLLIYLNLLSNRSYIDLFQYPVFPLPFFYDKVKENVFNYVDRKLNQHIGFQAVTEKSKKRKLLIMRTYEDSLKEYEDGPEEDEVEPPSYFTTHFSNNFYVSNFLLRLFPYSFLAIELQGSGFDSPNRLFFSIEDTFNNISYHKSDLRELIPEFYYFPEMLWNLNKLNFGKRQNGSQVEDVLMPQDMTKIDREKNKERNSINLNDEYEKSDYFKSFKFIEKMRNLLESKQTDIVSWINIIFGPGQKYNNPKKEDLYFRNGSYIDYSDVKIDELKAYRHDQTAMTSVEFGITPIQTVFEGDTGKSKNRNNIYNYTVKDNKEIFKNICKYFVDKINKPKSKESKETKESKDCKDNTEKTSINKEENNRNKNEQKYIKGIYKIISSNKMNEYNPSEENKSQINNIFIDSEMYINCIFQNDNIKVVGYKNGKVEVFKVNENDDCDLITEIFDHSDEICYIYYNQRLNMICTSSTDGFINAYSLPNKLITTIKNPNHNYFDMVFLCSNPFPSIVAFEKESLDFFSYSINGYKIKQVNLYNLLEIDKEKKSDIFICSHFNERGGTFKDRLIFIENNPNEKENLYKCHLIKVPFFDKEDRIVEIKKN